MHRLAQSVERATAVLGHADLSSEASVSELLDITTDRRRLDLSDLSPAEQANLLAGRAHTLQPSADALAERVTAAGAKRSQFIAKLGIDPTGHEVHLGHAVPMLVLSRIQRMGHEVVLIVGDVTAKIGDPSGRSDERPALTDEEIAANLATYRAQVSPFFDFESAQFRHNGDWLRQVSLPRLIEITSQIPVSMPMQREDFRKRLAAGQGLSVAELLYSVAMALDSVEVGCDIELGGIDQFLNMQMCRKVMEICGLAPELVLATPLLEGTDGTGAKMSKSLGNYVPLTAAPAEIFGKVMSIPDQLVVPWFKALSEWDDAELDLLARRTGAGEVRPLDCKRILAGEVTAALHGLPAATAAREHFAARFSRHSFGEVEDLPIITDLGLSTVEAARALGFAKSNGDVRRIAAAGGVRLVGEAGGAQEQFSLSVTDALAPLGQMLAKHFDGSSDAYYLKVGRKLALIAPSGQG